MKTTAARLSALYLLLFSIGAVFLVFYMTSLAAGFLINQTQESVASEIRSLGQVYNRGGLRLLVREIDRRSRRPGAYVYMVADQTGRILSGNVGSLEPGVLDRDGWTRTPFAYTRIGMEDDALDDDDAPRAIAQVIKFENGLTILVGRDLGEPQRFRVVIRQSLGMALAIMAAAGLLIWFFVGRQALKRMDRMSAASARIIGGDLSERLPVSGSNDEFDRLSSNLNGMLARIERLNTGLREVSDSIAHDLKTPLTRLRNRAEAALRGKDDPAAYRAALEDMIGESDQLIRIFNAMLLISRVEAGHASHSAERVDLSAVAADLAELYEPVVEDAGGTLVNAVPAGLVVNGNRELISQAITNLIDNAVKYGLSGSSPVVTLDGRAGPAGIHLSVADNGNGVPEHDRERVVERFVRLDESRSEGGSGLGLSLVSAIMRMHKGQMSLEDAAPGLKVVLSFPVPADNNLH